MQGRSGRVNTGEHARRWQRQLVAIREETARVPVTVLMPAYNSAATVQESARSVQEQTFDDWRLLIIDDGSTDATPEVCKQLVSQDERILYLRVNHIGFCSVLNLGLEVIGSPYVARLDSDDVAYPERLEKQMGFLARHPEVKVLGTFIDRVSGRGRRLLQFRDGPTTLREYEEWKASKKPFFLSHSSVVADRQVLLECGGYRWQDYPADDVALWTRVAATYPVLVLPEVLVKYRITPWGISGRKQELMILQWLRLDHKLRTGEELSVEELRQRIQSNWIRRLRFRAGCIHKSALRTGGYLLANGQWLRGLGYILLGTLAEPQSVARRLWVEWRS